MYSLFNKSILRSLVLLAVCGLCVCVAQNYYSSAPYSTSPFRANPYRRASYSPYRDYNSEYYEALRQRRLRALADSYRDIYNRASSSGSISAGSNSNSNGGSGTAQRFHTSSRLPKAIAAISATSNDGGSSNTITSSSNNNYDQNTSSNYNRYEINQQDAPSTTNKPSNSKADEQNAKFAGIRNQEADDESSKTLLLLKKKKKLRRCLPFGRHAQADEVTPPPAEQGRILWDLNVYNVYGGYPPPAYDGGCGGLGGGLGGGLASAFAGAGGLGGGGLFSDPIADAYAPPNRLSTFLQLFAPGILQNSLAVTARPPPFRPQSDTSVGEANELANDPEVDPGYSPVAARPPPVRRPNRVYYDSQGAAPLTPAQLVGGVATTVNGIIQQLTGNVQPVYPGYRSLSYGK